MNKALDLAKKILNDNKIMMSPNEIYDYALKNYSNDLKDIFSGSTPEKTIGSQLYTNVKRKDSEFISTKKGTKAKLFGIKGIEYTNIDVIDENDEEDYITDDEDDGYGERNKSDWDESDLHKFLVSYMFDYGCYCMTIGATKDKTKNMKKNKHTWLHADIFGVTFFKETYNPVVMNLLKNNNETRFDLYAFEMKKEITLSKLNEYYSEAASNSSWANYGYLVAKDINEDDPHLMDKLEIYNRTFGIGVIKLNVKTYSESKILFEARKKQLVDYAFIDDLINLDNDDINKFFNEVNAVCNDERPSVLSDKFDEPFESDVEGEKYALSKHMIE